jgi:hypothetical protein
LTITSPLLALALRPPAARSSLEPLPKGRFPVGRELAAGRERRDLRAGS